MDFKEKISTLAQKANQIKDTLQTEEATKTALIMPFINTLGYDVFNPLEVIPEYIADVGVKKGEKVDYAILKDGKPTILVECKKVENSGLDIKKHGTQLYRYFTASRAKFIIFTNGIIYKFFSDVDESGHLDNAPFFTFNLLNFKENQLAELQNFCKDAFDVQKAFSNASDLKYISRFVDVLTDEYNNPSYDFISYLIKKSGIYEGRMTQQLTDKHRKTTIEAFNSFMSKTMKNVLEGNISLNVPKENEAKKADEDIVSTTVEELEGYAIVKSILNAHIDVNRVVYRDNKSYFNIILDDNILKTVCRLYFNASQKYIAFVKDKSQEKISINSINDIYQYGEMIINKTKEIDANYGKKAVSA